MALADSNSVKIRYAQESTWGETPSGPAATELRITSESLVHNKETIVSETIRSDRQRDNLLQVQQSAEGELGFELAYSDYEPFFENAFRNTISSATVALASCTVAASSITGPAGTDFVASFEAGQWIKIQSTGNNQDESVAQITSLTSTVLTTTGTTLSASVLASAAITGRTLKNGTTKNSYFLEADFTDLSAVKYFSGMRVSECGVQFQASQIITGTFGFMGKKGFTASASVASTTTSAGTNTPMTAAVNVGEVREGGTVLTNKVQAFSFSLNNNMRARPQVGSTTTAEPGDGGVDVSGNMTVYFEDTTLYDKFVNHTETSISVKMNDVDGNKIILTLPAVQFSSGNPLAPGVDQDVFLSMDYTAFRDTTDGYTARLDFLPA